MPATGGREAADARFSLLGNLPGTLIDLFSAHLHLAVLPPVSLGFCPPQPYREPEASVAEPPSCPLALDLSLGDSSYGVTPGPCVVAQLPPEDVSHLTDPQSRDQGFLRTKMKVRTVMSFCLEAWGMCDPCLTHRCNTRGTGAESWILTCLGGAHGRNKEI